MDISVVVPVYNSASSLPQLVQRLKPVLESCAEEYELILVNDGSRDNSWSVICKLVSEHNWLCGIDLVRNYGQHNALLCGIRAARYEVTVTMDDDLQHPPEEIPKLLAQLGDENAVVYGVPEKEQHSLWRDAASQITKLALRMAMNVKEAPNVSAFRAFHTNLRDTFANYQSPDVSIDVLLTWGTGRLSAVRVRHEPRRFGASNYSFRMLVNHAMNMATGYSAIPLQVATIIGFFFSLFGVAVLFYVVGRYLVMGGSVPGFPFLASIIAIFSGAQLFALGIIGEYLARMHFRTMGRPSSVIRDIRRFS